MPKIATHPSFFKFAVLLLIQMMSAYISPSSHHSEINLLEENSCTGADKGLSQHSLASNSSPRQLPQEKEQGKHTQRFPFGLSHPLRDVSLGVSSAQSLLLSL